MVGYAGLWAARATCRPLARTFATTAEGPPHTVPVLPSVTRLLALNHLAASDVQATGIRGSLRKGDVLFHLKRSPDPRETERLLLNNPHPHTLPQAPPMTAMPPPQAAAPTPERPRAAAPAAPAAPASPATPAAPSFTTRAVPAGAGRGKQVPHSYASMSCSLGNAQGLVERLNAAGTPVQLVDLVAHAISLAVVKFPECNSYLNGDTVVAASSVNVALGGSGVVLPSADRLSLRDIHAYSSQEVCDRSVIPTVSLVDLSSSAVATGTLPIANGTACTFVVSGLHSEFGPTEQADGDGDKGAPAAPAANAKEGAAAGVTAEGATAEEGEIEWVPFEVPDVHARDVVVEVPASFQARTVCTVSVSFDGRAVTEAAVADCLAEVRALLEVPQRMLV